MRSPQGFLARHKRRFYGLCCGSSNGLLLAKGLVSHDPLIAAGAYMSLGAQAGNLAFDKAAERYTAPALVLSGVAFAASGLHRHGMSLADASHVGFGVCKMVGITALFYGRDLGRQLEDAPGLRLVARLLRARSETVGEAFLAVAASSMAIDGFKLLALGGHAHDAAATGNGACTLAAMGLFLAGNRIRARRSTHEPSGP